MSYPDDAAFGDLSVLSPLLNQLDRFNQFEGPDPAGRRQHSWKAHLGTPLPLKKEPVLIAFWLTCLNGSFQTDYGTGILDSVVG